MSRDYQTETDRLISDQLNNWSLARNNYCGLDHVLTREIVFNSNLKIKIQFNPERMRSSAAKVDPISIQERKCFLCAVNLPDEQWGIEFLNKYQILVNPFPIFRKHLTIPLQQHTDQRIQSHFGEMLLLAQSINQYVVFYNGPQCGASAPDHFHFQAGNKGFMPIDSEFETIEKTRLNSKNNCNCYAIDHYLRKTVVLTGPDIHVLIDWFNNGFEFLKTCTPSDPEPMLNILALWTGVEWRVFIFPRKKHRPDQYFKEGNDQILLSPASVDFGGVFITPREEDYYKLDENMIRNIFEQLTIDDAEWEAVKIHFCNIK